MKNGSPISYTVTSNNSPTIFDVEIDKEIISEVSLDDQAQKMNFDSEAYVNIGHVTIDVQNVRVSHSSDALLTENREESMYLYREFGFL